MSRAAGFALLLAIAACGCAARPGEVGARMVLPPMAPVIEVRKDQHFLMAVHLNPRHFPAYPVPGPAQAPARVSTCIEFIVDEHGAVASARPLQGTPDCPGGDEDWRAPFDAAARDAVLAWEFTAAALCTFPPGMESNDDCAGEGVVEQAVPLRLVYAFDFVRGERRARIARSSAR